MRNDIKQAAARLDAALESKDHSGINVAGMRNAMETLDKGHPEAAIPLLDQALSLPPGASSGTALHEAGSEFQPATGAQEIVALATGALLLALGALVLWRAEAVAETCRRAGGRASGRAAGGSMSMKAGRSARVHAVAAAGVWLWSLVRL